MVFSELTKLIVLLSCFYQIQAERECTDFNIQACECGVILNKVGCPIQCIPCFPSDIRAKSNLKFPEKSSIESGEGVWSEWGQWSVCDVTCDLGYQQRIRMCMGGVGGVDCLGSFYDFQLCNNASCAGVVSSWEPWGTWSSCDAPCGTGSRYRTRNCTNGEVGSNGCEEGTVIENESCSNKNCPLYIGIHCWDNQDLSSYRGFIKVAAGGRKCRFWNNRRSPFRAADYPGQGLVKNNCRNPNGGRNKPWCFTNNKYTRKEACNVPLCNLVADWGEWGSWSGCSIPCDTGQRSRVRECVDGFVTEGNCVGDVIERESCMVEVCPTTTAPTTATTQTTSSAVVDCATSSNSIEYRGTAHFTISGEACQRWDSSTPHVHPFYTVDNIANNGLVENYCRNPDGDAWPWCISSNQNQYWDYCDILECMPETSTQRVNEECYNPANPSAYRGVVSTTVSGIECQRWDFNQPHRHYYKSFKYIGKGLGPHNYCRVPDDDAKPWCITSDPSKFWDYCQVESCVTTTTIISSTLLPPTTLPGNTQCGNPIFPIINDDVSQRVVGGRNAAKGSLPWIVSLRTSNDHSPICGGSIIANRWILTASHCMIYNNANSYEAVLGNFLQYAVDPEERTIRFTAIFKHRNYNGYTLYNDIALMKTINKIAYTQYIKPICLPSQAGPQSYNIGDTMLISGWGSTGNNYPNVLQQAYAPIYDYAECKTKYDQTYGTGAINNGMLCIGYPQGGIDTCQGDSGGPVIDTRNYQQIGVVSWGRGCALAGYPGVYTDVGNSLVAWQTSMH